MKKVLLTAGIVLIAAGAAALFLAGIWFFASSHTLDGSAALYAAQRRYMMISLLAGAVLEAAGVLCIVRRSRF